MILLLSDVSIFDNNKQRRGEKNQMWSDLSVGEREKYERVNCECTIVERMKKRRKNIVVHCLPGVSSFLRHTETFQSAVILEPLYALYTKRKK